MPELRLRGGEVDGLALHYLVEGRGPAVVLVHGLGGFAASWRHNIPSLAARATVYAVDLPGFGRSGKPSAAYSLAYFARALHAFLEAVGVTQVSIVGHSLGAAVAVTYALTRPARVERRADYRRAIATLDVPVLLVHGRQDPAIPAAHCAETAEGFARGSVRWLDACGHFPHIEHAQVVNGWLADFLVGRPAPR